MASLVEPGEKVLIGNSGIWGTRAAEIARRYGGCFPLPPRPRTPQHSLACNASGARELPVAAPPGTVLSRDASCLAGLHRDLSAVRVKQVRDCQCCRLSAHAPHPCAASEHQCAVRGGTRFPERCHCCGLSDGKMKTLAAPPAFPQAQLSRVPGGLPV